MDEWSRRRRVLVGVSVALLCLVAGWAWIVVLDRPMGVVDGTKPGHIVFMAVAGGLLLAFAVVGLYVSAYALLAAAAVIAYVIRAPAKFGRWVAANGARGMAGHAVNLVALATGLTPLFVIGHVTDIGPYDWAFLIGTVAFAATAGGMVGGFIFGGVSFLLPWKRAESAVDFLLPIGVVLGAVVGAYMTKDDMMVTALAASSGGPLTVIAIALSYIGGLYGLRRAARYVRRRARLVPDIGTSPDDSPDPFWSPTPVVAWRAWMPTRRGLLGAWNATWKGAEFEATCEQSLHPAPDWSCRCGIYALKAPPLLDGNRVIGLVELSGRVIEHENGYRAQRARILHMWWIPDSQSRAHREMLLRRFGRIPIDVGMPDANLLRQEEPWET